MTPVLISDTGLAGEIAALINRVYAAAEEGIWLDGKGRTTEAEVAGLIAAGQIAVARSGERIVGSVRVHQLDDGAGEFGMLVAAPEERGTGIGTDLVAFAEDWGRERGAAEMQLELLVPQGWAHPVKEFLRGWYTRIGWCARTASKAPIRSWCRTSPARATSSSSEKISFPVGELSTGSIEVRGTVRLLSRV